MARRSKKNGNGIGPGLIVVILSGVVLFTCLICAGGGTVAYVLRNNANKPGQNLADNRPPPQQNLPPDRPIRKLTQVRYTVIGNPRPNEQSGRIRQALESLPGVEPGSVETTATTIRFLITEGSIFTPANDVVTMQFGYQITQTYGGPWP